MRPEMHIKHENVFKIIGIVFVCKTSSVNVIVVVLFVADVKLSFIVVVVIVVVK